MVPSEHVGHLVQSRPEFQQKRLCVRVQIDRAHNELREPNAQSDHLRLFEQILQTKHF